MTLEMINAEIRLIMFFAAEDGEALRSQKKNKTEQWHGSDQECLKENFTLTLKKVWKLLDHLGWPKSIPYDYTVDVTNRFDGLDLIDRLPREIWAKGHVILHEKMNKSIPKKNKCKKAKALSEEALQIA